jgi:predicted metal-dependent peptidase
MYNEFTKALFAVLQINPVVYGFCKLLPLEMSEDIPTAALNGRVVKINPKFWSDLDTDSRAFVIAHEAMHIAWDFFGRLGMRNKMIFNAAQDLVINEFLSANNFKFTGNYDLITAKDFPDLQYDSNRHSSEVVYDWLIRNRPNLAKQMADKVLDGCGQEPQPGDGGPLTPQEVEDLRMAVQGVIVGSPPGTLPSELVRAVESAWVPAHDWRTELSRYFNQLAPDDYSLKKFSMNNLAVTGALTPTLNTPGLTTIGVVFDTSGSMSDLYSEVVGHVQEILSQISVAKVIRIDADTNVAFEEETTGPGLVATDFRFHGGGGTCFREAIQRMEHYSPDVVVYITDGHGTFPDNPPPYPLVWLDLLGTVEYPFGDVVRCKT